MYLDEGAGMASEGRYRELRKRFYVGEEDRHKPFFFGVGDDVVDFGDTVGEVGDARCHTACDDDGGAGVLLRKLADEIATFAVGGLCDSAAVDDTDIGTFAVGSFAAA